MGKLLVDTNERIKFNLYIDLWPTVPRAVPNICPLIQGETPCKSKKENRCEGIWSLCDDKDHCGDIIGKQIAKYSKPRSQIEKFTIGVCPESFGLLNFAESKSFEIDKRNDQRYINAQKFRIWKLKLMLKEWDLDRIEPELKIELHEVGLNTPEMLTDDFFKKLLRMPGSLMRDIMVIILKHIEHHTRDAPDPN